MENITAIARSERVWVLIEIIGVCAFALLSRAVLMPIAWRYAGPASLLLVIAVLTVYLRRRGMRWREFGLCPLPGARAKLWVLPQALLTFGAFCLAVAIVMIGGDVLHLEFMAKIPHGVTDRWRDMHGNLPLYLVWLAIAWISGGLFEEMFFRGYLITRLRTVFSDSRAGSVAAVILAAAFFGYGHMYYQGLRGLITTMAIGLALGTMFLRLRRNLWPIILVHAVVDSISMTAIFMAWK